MLQDWHKNVPLLFCVARRKLTGKLQRQQFGVFETRPKPLLQNLTSSDGGEAIGTRGASEGVASGLVDDSPDESSATVVAQSSATAESKAAEKAAEECATAEEAAMLQYVHDFFMTAEEAAEESSTNQMD